MKLLLLTSFVLLIPAAGAFLAFSSPPESWNKCRFFQMDEVNRPQSLACSRLFAELPRRKFQSGLLNGIVGGGALSLGSKVAGASSAGATNALVDVPMVRLKLPRGGFGREYVALKLKIQDQGPFDFMVDSGLTLEMISPHLQGILAIQEGKSRLAGLAAGGSTTTNALVPLTGAAIAGNDGSSSDLALPPLTAVITNFPQEHIDPAHDPVEGMLGMEVVGAVED